MLRDVLAYVGLQSWADDTTSATTTTGDGIGATEQSASSSSSVAVDRGIYGSRPSMSCAPPHMQKILQEHQTNGGPSIRLVIRGARRTGKSTLMARMQGGGDACDSSSGPVAYYPTQSIQPGVCLWRPRPSTSSLGAGATSSALRETRVELWDVVDKGTPNPCVASAACGDAGSSGTETARMMSGSRNSDGRGSTMMMLATDASTVDVYRGAHGVIFMYDVTNRESFDYVLEALPRVPRQLPIAICGNFWDLACKDKEQAEVDTSDIQRCLATVAQSAVTPLFASFLAAATAASSVSTKGAGSASSFAIPAALSSFVVPPSHIYLSVKDGFGLTPLHRFTGLCAAFAKAVELDAAVRSCYGRVASACEDLHSINDEQSYEEFLQWKADAAEARRKEQEQDAAEARSSMSAHTGTRLAADVSQQVLRVGRASRESSSSHRSASIRSAGRAKQRPPLMSHGVLGMVDGYHAQQPQHHNKLPVGAADRLAAAAMFGDSIDASFFESLGAEGVVPSPPSAAVVAAGTINDPQLVGSNSSSDDDPADFPCGGSVLKSASSSIAPPQRAFQKSVHERKLRVMGLLPSVPQQQVVLNVPDEHLQQERQPQPQLQSAIDDVAIAALAQRLEEELTAAACKRRTTKHNAAGGEASNVPNVDDDEGDDIRGYALDQ
jgi:GTPase SAR1 family protein